MPVYRKLLPAERHRYRAHLLRLDRADRYARFSGTVSDEVVERHCGGIDWGRTIVVGGFFQGELCGAIELCSERLFWPKQAELAVSVDKPLQEQGLGAGLVRRALTIARNRWIERVHMLCQVENRRMVALSRRFGGAMAREGGELAVAFVLPPPDQFSLVSEVFDDGADAVGTVIDR